MFDEQSDIWPPIAPIEMEWNAASDTELRSSFLNQLKTTMRAIFAIRLRLWQINVKSRILMGTLPAKRRIGNDKSARICPSSGIASAQVATLLCWPTESINRALKHFLSLIKLTDRRLKSESCICISNDCRAKFGKARSRQSEQATSASRA